MTPDETLLDWDALRERLSTVEGLRPLGLREVDIGAGAVRRLAEVVDRVRAGRAGAIGLLRDTVAKRVDGRDLHDAVAGALAPLGPVSTVTLNGPHERVHADEATTDAALAGTAGVAVLVTVGSGTLADLGKLAAATNDLPHVIVQTAASVNGFADDQSVVLRSGVKRTVASRWPEALIADADVLAEAPAPLNLAGVGDLLSMFTAPADWLLAESVGFAAGYHPLPVELVRPHGDRLLSLAPRLVSGDREALTRLAELLTLSGVSMGVAGRTTPSSGLEHLVSHLLDMHAAASGRTAASHGSQVGVGSLVATATWARVRAALRADRVPRIRPPDPDAARERVAEAFGPLGADTVAECWTAYSAKLRELSTALPTLERLLADWERFDARLDGLLVPASRLVEPMRAADAPVRFADLSPGYEPQVVRWALASAHLMRERFTVADLAELLGLGGADGADAVLDDLAAVGAGR